MGTLAEHLEFDFGVDAGRSNASDCLPLAEQLIAFRGFGQATRVIATVSTSFAGQRLEVPTYVNEFWTARQRQAANLHEVSYRACFKPQLPRFFIDRLSAPGDRVYDPFMGRGTTPIEAALLGRVPVGCDANPLSLFLTRPRLNPPTLDRVVERLEEIDFGNHDEYPEKLLVFYHPDTLRQICALRKYLTKRKEGGGLDAVDEWIWMVGINRLTGHSPGFFSVYSMPPNQAVSVESQIKINRVRGQTPPRRDVPGIILKKSRQLLAECTGRVRQTLEAVRPKALLVTSHSASTPEIPAGSVTLVVTSPPFLNVVDYAGDNWLRCWFIGVDPKSVRLTVPRKLEDWQSAMSAVFGELARVLRTGGHVVFEVGEVQRGEIKLEQAVIPCGVAAGLEPELILINDQKFTKTANCWGVDNNFKGTNTNRIVLFRKS